VKAAWRRSLARADARDDALAIKRALARTAACPRCDGLPFELANARHLAGTLARARNLADARDRARTLTYTLIYIRGHHPAVGRDLADAHGRASDLARDLDRFRDAEGGGKSENCARSGHVASSARRLVTMTSWLLPASDRARYRREYRSELWDLAAAGTGHHQQIQYAARLLLRVAPLRLAVLSPRQRKASP
jgi:hypothetical protein